MERRRLFGQVAASGLLAAATRAAAAPGPAHERDL